MDLREFNPTAQQRKKYFEGRGFEAPPFTQEERFNKALSFLKEGEEDYEACVELYDLIEDYDFVPFLNILGFVYALKDTPLSDDTKAIEYYGRALHFAINDEQKIYAANGLLASYFRLHNIEPKDYHELYKEPRVLRAVETLIAAGEEPKVFLYGKNYILARKLMSEFYGAGLGVPRDPQKSQDLNWNYRWQKDDPKFANKGYYHTDNILGVMAVLGLGRKQSNNLARFIFETSTYAKKDSNIYAQKVIEYAKKRENPSYDQAAQKLMDAYSKNPNPLSLIKVIRDASQPDLEAMVDTLWMLSGVAMIQNWPDREGIYNMYLTAFSIFKPHSQTSATALPDMSVYNNTYKYGPFYNRLDKYNVPIWGDFEASFVGSDHERKGKRIPSGWRSFSGLSTDTNRNIHFQFEKSLFKPAMIFQEDLDVILALVYGSEKPLWPSLGLYNTGSGFHPHDGMKVKGFDPEWLTVTDLGKTFYVCDYLSGMLAFTCDWDIGNFPMSQGKNKRAEELGRALKAMIADITDGGKPKHPKGDDGYSEILNNNPEYVGFSDLPTQDGTHNLKINKVLMRIEGGFVDVEKMKETSGRAKPEVTNWEFRNDPAYRHTKITKTLTDYYDVVAEVMPVYERLRQLMGIINLVHKLHTKGFIPNQKIQQKAQEDLEFFAAKYKNLGMETEYIRAPLNQLMPTIMRL